RSNSWRGKRQTVEAAGFGFAVLFNGRRYAELKPLAHATAVGKSDAAAAVAAARQEGFPTGSTIFLDQEEGGRLLPEQRAYLHAWVDTINSSGFQAGVYCSGIGFREASGAFVITADDIREHAAGRKITYWVTNDACPPSPDAPFPKFRPCPRRAAFLSRRCGSSPNPRAGKILPVTAAITIEMATVIHPGWIPRSSCMWT